MTQANIKWDSRGTPSIEAETWAEAMHSWGYAQAYNHPNLLLAAMARGQGRAAEILGQHSGLPEAGLTKQPQGVDYLQSDRLVWQLDIAQLGHEYWAQQDAEMRAQVEAFCEGIAACRAEHKGRFDARFMAFEKITPAMVMAHVAHILVGFQVAIRMPTVGQWLGGKEAVFPSWNDFVGAGSNACVIGPSKSQNGNPMLVCNPHTQWDVDLNTFSEVRFKVGEKGAKEGFVGAGMVGWPGIMMGCNAHMGFAGTVNTQSSLTFYQLQINEDSYTDTYTLDGVPNNIKRNTRQIKCLQTNGEFTLHAQDQCWSAAHAAFSLAQRNNKEQQGEQNELLMLNYAGRPRGQLLRQFFDMIRAKSLGQFKTALSQHHLPMFNLLYAGRDEIDQQGRINYSFHSLPPQRDKGTWADWWHVLDGSKSANIVTGIVPLEEMFTDQDNTSGWYQNCNDSPHSCTLPSPFNPKDYAPTLSPVFTNFRAQNYSRLLDATDTFDFEAFKAAKFSTHVELAGRILPQILAAVEELTDHEHLLQLRQAGTVLSQWDRDTEPHSKGAYLFLHWVLQQNIEDSIASPLFSDRWNWALAADKKAWRESLDTPGQLASTANTIAALVNAIQQLQAEGHALDVAWQDAVVLQHGHRKVPAVGGPGDPLGIISAIPLTPSLRPNIKGGTLVANRIENDGGETFVMVVEFTPEGAHGGTLVSYGSSSIYKHPHNGDQLELLAKRQLEPFNLTKPAL